MLVLRPKGVRFGGTEWVGVSRVAIDSSSVEMAEEWDEEGPNLMYVDSTRRKTSVRVYQDIDGDDLASPDPGEEASIRIDVDRGNDADSRVILMSVVVQSVSYSFSGSRATREIRLVAVSSRGDVEPVSVIGGG